MHSKCKCNSFYQPPEWWQRLELKRYLLFSSQLDLSSIFGGSHIDQHHRVTENVKKITCKPLGQMILKCFLTSKLQLYFKYMLLIASKYYIPQLFRNGY